MADTLKHDVEAEHAPIKLRSYQQEMLEQSLERNVIVAMDTGSGKTHVAIMRIRAELEKGSSEKLVWFFAPNRALCEQQFQVITHELPAHHIRLLTGGEDPDKWTTSALWDIFLTGVHVVVGTPAVLADALTHGFITMAKLSLCVFDECHRCTGNHPMNKIMRDFYHTAKVLGNHVPHIMGLSASPVMSTKANSIQSIENNLDASAITPKLHQKDLMCHVHLPHMLRVTYHPESSEMPNRHAPTFAILLHVLRHYDISNDPYVLELIERDDEESSRLREKAVAKRNTYCIEQIQTVVNRATIIQEQTGSSVAEWYVRTCCDRFLDLIRNQSMAVLDLTEKEVRHLGQIFEAARDSSASSVCTIISAVGILSSKAQALVQALQQHAGPDSRCIIFVQQRATVSAIAYMLRSIPELAGMTFGTFTGTSTSSKRKTLIADLVDPKAQSSDLKDFRSGVKNVMIATDVLEEGLDVPATSVVLCFDLPKNLISFVQRRGRARQPDSKYLLFISGADSERDPASWQRLEERMKETYSDDSRGEPEIPAEDEDELATIKYLVPSTGALLTAENAKAHLYHFCAVSISETSRYIDPRPEFDPRQDVMENTWSATVTLPLFVHPRLRTATSSMAWKSEGAAIKEVAFVAYIALHKSGLVNDNLLPLAREPRSEAGQDHVDQPAILEVSERLNVWRSIAEAAQPEDARWHAAFVTLHLAGSPYAIKKIWMPIPVPEIDFLELFWSANVTYELSIKRSSEQLQANDTQQMELLARATKLTLSSCFSNRTSDGSDFAVLISPDHIRLWSQNSQKCQDATLYIRERGQSGDYSDAGLVHVKGEIGRSYVLQGLASTYSGTRHTDKVLPVESITQNVVVTPFPKRRDFLHALPKNNHAGAGAAYTTRQEFPLSQCTVDNLPLTDTVYAALLPSVLHRIETMLLAQKLHFDILPPVQFQNTNLLLEAISAPAAAEQWDYNRLEYLGDTVLKFCTELQLFAQHPTWPEAQLSAEKDRIVRNSTLARAAVDIGLDRYILMRPFTGSKWRPLYVSELLAETATGVRQMSSKTLADVVESLIGTAYIDSGLSNGIACLRIWLSQETWWDINMSMDRIRAELPDQQHTADLAALENIIGYAFDNRGLLMEAITHASYAPNRTGMSYERLEFLGDAVLDLIITPKLFAHTRKLRHWELHRVHEALVNAHFLGYCYMTMTADEAVYDITSAADSLDSPTVKHRYRVLHLYDFLRASREVNKAKSQAVSRFDHYYAAIASALDSGSLYPWPDLLAMHPEKFMSDCVESLLGALYIDSDGDLSVCEAFLELLGVLPIMRRMLDDGVETAHPRERLGILADRDEVKYTAVRESQSLVKTWRCTIKIGDSVVSDATGCSSREEAEARAAVVGAEKLMHDPERLAIRRRRKLVIADQDAVTAAKAEASYVPSD